MSDRNGTYPVFVYLDRHEKVQIGLATVKQEGRFEDVSIEFSVALYIEESEDKIVMEIPPKDLPCFDVDIEGEGVGVLRR